MIKSISFDREEDIFFPFIDDVNNYPTEKIILELYDKHEAYTKIVIAKNVRSIKLGRTEKKLCPIRRLVLVNKWRYLVHKYLDIKLK